MSWKQKVWEFFNRGEIERFKKLLNRELTPENIRPGMYFGYYGCTEKQVEETLDHVNLLWEFQWKPLDEVVENIRRANMDTVLDISHQLFTRYSNGYRLTAESENNLKELFDRLKKEKLLHHIKVLYPFDEPNLPGQTLSLECLEDTIRLTKKVASMYSELDGVKTGCIFAARHPIVGMHLFDIVGLDDYTQSAEELLYPKFGAYAKKILKNLQPHQMLFVVPGGITRQSPKEFINWASENEKVWGIIPFMWNAVQFGKDDIRDNGMVEEYRKAGLLIVAKKIA